MRRMLALAAVGGLVWVAAPRAADAPVIPVADAPLYGVAPESRSGRLAELHPLTLEPKRGWNVPVRGYVYWWRFSQDRRLVALAARNGTQVQLVDLDARRSLGITRLPRRRYVAGLGRPTPAAVVLVVGSGNRFWSAVADPGRGRLRLVTRLPSAIGCEPAGAGLACLGGRFDHLGQARVVLIDGEGRARVKRLARIPAGQRLPRGNDLPEAVARYSWPAIAPSADGSRVAVVSAAEPLAAEIDVASGSVSYHELREARSPLARLRDWLEPAAQAKVAEGDNRNARWLDDRFLAVSGWRDRGVDRRGRFLPAQRFGLRLLDTGDWTWRLVERRASGFSVAGGALLVNEPERGLRAYEPDGSMRFHRFGRRIVGRMTAFGRYAYVTVQRTGRRTLVLDLATGRTAGFIPHRRWPLLLVEW